MIVIKHGKYIGNDVKTVICARCDCTFQAKCKEFQFCIDETTNENYMSIDCPECFRHMAIP